MTTMQDGFSPEAVQESAGRRTSGMAVAALLCSLILCCPVTTVMGVLLGIIAFARTGVASAHRGRGLAVAAILIGLAATAGQMWLYSLAQSKIVEPMEIGPRDALTAGFNGDIAAFKSSFYGAGASASDEEAAAFIDELRTRYGAFIGSVENQQSPPQGGPVMEFDYALEFENATVPALTQIVFADQNTGDWPGKLGFILVHDPDAGELVYPPGLDVDATRGTVP